MVEETHMSEHRTKHDPIGAFLTLAVICLLAAYGFGKMNDGGLATGAVPALLLFGIGSYVILALGSDDEDA